MVVPAVQETIRDLPPDKLAVSLALDKAAAAARQFLRSCARADTLVVCAGKIMGKPRDAAAARRMLETLSGREHSVFTGLALIDAATGRTETAWPRPGSGCVSERELIDAYLATGEPMDKAGAYAFKRKRPSL